VLGIAVLMVLWGLGAMFFSQIFGREKRPDS
jgi:hypothetical protein